MTITDQTPALAELAGWTEAEILFYDADAEESSRNEQLDAQRERDLYLLLEAEDICQACGLIHPETGCAATSRFAITESAHGWQWTYSNITKADAQHIAGLLSGSGETWTVTEVAA